jgi:DNA (cytosine-5)-methyltransferase 1
MANNQPLRVFSMFTGIGGFEVGLTNSNLAYEMVGFSEVDKYAIQIYNKHFKGIKNYGDATTINETELPNFDLLVGGFPCQAFSMAGKRKGFNDTRGTLFFDIARILSKKKPKYFILENVKGLLSHDKGRTLQTIFGVLSDLGYEYQWEVLNSKNFGVPQNRERVYIVGHLRGTSRPKIFPIGQSEEISDTSRESQGSESSQISSTITSNYKRGVHAMGEQYIVENKLKQIGNIDTKGHNSIWGRVYDTQGISATINAHGGGLGAKTGLYKVQVREATKKGYAVAEEGDSINLSVPNSNTRRGRVGKQIAQTIDTGMQQHTLQDSQIRRLTPRECERLQGFPDDWTEGISDTQRYKCLGNAVTTNVVTAIINRLYSNN